MMGTAERAKQAAKLSSEIAGAEVVAVLPLEEDEGWFVLRLKKDGKKFDVRVYGTELGWWHRTAGGKR